MAPESESLVLNEYHGGLVAEAHVARSIERADYLALSFNLHQMIRSHDKIRLLLQIHHFHGWQTSASWQDLAPSERPPFSGIDRLALVASPCWQSDHHVFTRPFIRARTRFFPTSEGSAARDWIDQGLAG